MNNKENKRNVNKELYVDEEEVTVLPIPEFILICLLAVAMALCACENNVVATVALAAWLFSEMYVFGEWWFKQQEKA